MQASWIKWFGFTKSDLPIPNAIVAQIKSTRPASHSSWVCDLNWSSSPAWYGRALIPFFLRKLATFSVSFLFRRMRRKIIRTQADQKNEIKSPYLARQYIMPHLPEKSFWIDLAISSSELWSFRTISSFKFGRLKLWINQAVLFILRFRSVSARTFAVAVAVRAMIGKFGNRSSSLSLTRRT